MINYVLLHVTNPSGECEDKQVVGLYEDVETAKADAFMRYVAKQDIIFKPYAEEPGFYAGYFDDMTFYYEEWHIIPYEVKRKN